MNLKEVANYVELDERTVSGMAERGEIPASKVANQWRFDRAAVDSWMAKRGAPVPDTEQQLPAEATGIPEPLTVASVLAPSRVNMDLRSTDRDGVLRELVALVIDPKESRLFEMLFEALKAREDLCSTCVNDGVAIPHSRNALIGVVDHPMIAYGRHQAGIDFGALDGQLVHHFFLLCAPNVREHLLLLARLARLLRNRDFVAKLNGVKQANDLLTLVRDAEQSIKPTPA